MASSSASTSKIWDPSTFLSPINPSSSTSPRPPQALIILNLPILRLDIFERAWKSTDLRYCADGGANRLFDAFRSEHERRRYLPDLIKGDLDSIRPEVRSFYESLGVSVVHDPDQYSTDLMKCIHALKAVEASNPEGTPQYDLILFGGLTGRLDQTTHTLHLLHKLRTEREKIWVISEDELAWCLDVGEHTIPINHSLLGQTCGILPLGIDSAVISTKGLEWNVENWETSFSTQISTSNHLMPGEDVWIQTSGVVWWCCAIREWK
ncbi:thiamine pyrophosphokinase [Mrakia frigida]|uniref:thiamine diphosphokinase n=1 Tax=Mrakia frigida TaxID=29902 RepID=UPI003FCC0D95